MLAAGFQQQKILATLDTGAESTDLFERFAKEFATLLRERGKKSSTEIRGVGQAESYDSITVPELKFKIGGVETVLRPAHVLLQHEGAKGIVNLTNRVCRRPALATYSVDAHRSCSLSPSSFPR